MHRCSLTARGAVASLVLDLWRQAQFREERYAAIELVEHRLARRFQDLDALPMYEEMIVTGPGGIHVDALATHRLSALLCSSPRRSGGSCGSGAAATICGNGGARFCARFR